MSTKHQLPPLHRQALLAMITDPKGALERVPGGFFCPSATGHPVFTSRTVKGMDRDGLVRLDSDLCTQRVELSAEGRALAVQLQEAVEAKAAAA